MKVVLLAGGRGTRIMEETNIKPKPMVYVGGKPILWHIMKEFSYYGFNEFIICAGYKQEVIKEWFYNYFINSNDITLDYTHGRNDITVNRSKCEPWKVTIVDTGCSTMTGGRIKRIKDYITNEDFFLTYGDGVCDINIKELLKYHQSHKKIATLTSVKIQQDKGVLDIDERNSVRFFREKNKNDGYPINAGYMVLSPAIFDYIDGDSTIFEKDVLEKLASEGQLKSYIHNGFWQCMDNIREKEILEKLISSNKAPWIKWEN